MKTTQFTTFQAEGSSAALENLMGEMKKRNSPIFEGYVQKPQVSYDISNASDGSLLSLRSQAHAVTLPGFAGKHK